jgi:hypothetical protein
MNDQQEWMRGLSSGREHEFPRWREVEPDGRWQDWWDEEVGLMCVVDWPDEDGGVDAGAQSLS